MQRRLSCTGLATHLAALVPLPPPSCLAVTQLAFSPNGRFLASASRDRTVALFERQPGTHAGTSAAGAAAAAAAPGGDQVAGFRLVGRIKAHARIVWGLHWSPDSHLLATASRDGKGEGLFPQVSSGELGARALQDPSSRADALIRLSVFV